MLTSAVAIEKVQFSQNHRNWEVENVYENGDRRS
jgi:hypothetical protein